MRKVSAALAAESAELQQLVLDVLGPAQRDALAFSLLRAGENPAQTPDLAIFIGNAPNFWERCRPALLRLARRGGRIVCICRAAPDWLGGVANGEILPLPEAQDARAMDLFRKSLLIRVKSVAAHRDDSAGPVPARRPSGRLVGIGSSTGGPQVLLSILNDLPPDTCGILIVQHLSTGFSSRFSDYLDELCAMRVKQAENGEVVEDGTVYLAEDGRHLTVVRQPDGYRLRSLPGEKVNGFCPSADRLFESLAAQAGGSAMGIVLTGLGNDGAEGLLHLRQAGGQGLAQSESSCAAPSMPREAARLGGAEEQLTPAALAERIRRFAFASPHAPFRQT